MLKLFMLSSGNLLAIDSHFMVPLSSIPEGNVNNKHRRTLEAIFEKPIRSNLKWKDIESLFKHLKADITKGSGSFVAVELNGARSVFHRPHPRPDTDKGAVVAVRDFSRKCGNKTMIKYKGYVGQATYDDEAKIFHGRVIGLKDVITFQGTTVKEIEQAFKDAIDFYLEWCKKRDEKPEKTFSGNLHIRIDPSLHAKLAQKALLEGVSLNSFIVDKLKN